MHAHADDSLNEGSIEIIQDKLYWVWSDSPPVSEVDAFYFSTDNLPEIQYDPFHEDFGPYKLSMVHRYWWEVVRLLQDPNYNESRIYHYWSTAYDKQANAACLIGCFMIIILKRTADEVWYSFKSYHKAFVPYRDSSGGPCTYKLSIYDVLCGLQKAISVGWYDFRKFDVHEYEYYEKVENGDLNWIIPNKILALMGPSGKRVDKLGHNCHTPEDYSPLFQWLNVERIIRLNKASYNKKRFTKFGFKFNDLYFLDGSTPSLDIVYEFIKLWESTKRAIAVHCKAGLGRTGTLIGWYAMKNYGFSASEFIGWIRLARPGSVLGPQQHYLEEMEDISLSHQIFFGFISCILLLSWIFFRKQIFHPIIITTFLIYYFSYFINPIIGFRYSPYVILSILLTNFESKYEIKSLTEILNTVILVLLPYFLYTYFDTHYLWIF